ncbi:MAG TPA: hypothetical protein VKW78_11175 [Terriglobales bacterium]|nr:hypothetical protein [Terriglobales bacterium]
METRSTRVLLLLFLLALLTPGLRADERGEGPIRKDPPKGGITPEQIIQKFAAKEKEFKTARENYTYRQDVRVQTLDDGGSPDGEYRMVTDVLFDPQGKRTEQVVFAPQSTLERISMTKEDMDDIQHRLPFVLTTDEIPEYDILYVGQQQEDELNTYVFDIAPKKIEKGKRYFQGRIWVDDTDFQIVKTRGKNVPDIRSRGGENLFPEFTTWREQIDSQDGTGRKFWFPTFTKIDDTLHFSNGDVHVREIVKYENYKRFGSNVKITYEGQDINSAPNNQQPQPTAPQTNPSPAPAQSAPQGTPKQASPSSQQPVYTGDGPPPAPK